MPGSATTSVAGASTLAVSLVFGVSALPASIDLAAGLAAD